MTTTEEVLESQKRGGQSIAGFVVRSTLVERYEAELGPGSVDAFQPKHAPLSFPLSS